VGADASTPIPPLTLVAPWAIVIAIPLALLVLIAVSVYVLARRHFASQSLGMGAR
jgi:hypothetical protein